MRTAGRFSPVAVGLVVLAAAGCDAYAPDADQAGAGTGTTFGDGVVGVQAGLDSQGLSPIGRNALMLSSLAIVNNPARTADPCAAVAADANKKWTFGYLMGQAANQAATGKTPSQFVKAWLDTMTSTQTVNGQPIIPTLQKPGLGAQVLGDWKAKSKAGDTLYMQHAPFRLLAIVPRFDLRQKRRFGEGIAGEMRFVFGTLRLNDVEPGTTKCHPANQTSVILEYAVDRADENQVLKWARDWKALSGYALGSTQHLAAIEALTESVVRAGVSPQRPNGSALIRIRTQENTDASGMWFFREWGIDSTTHLPVARTTKQSPKMSLLPLDRNLNTNAQTVGQWINQNETAIMNGTYVVPDRYPIVGGENFVPLPDNSPDPSAPPDFGDRFLGVFGRNSTNEARLFRASFINNREARHQFAKGTCVGCHSVETGTNIFHIEPRFFASEATLSEFLAGDGAGGYVQVKDPDDPTSFHYFNELADCESDLTVLTQEYSTLPANDINYKVRFRHDGKCTDLPNSSKTVGAATQQWACNGNANQRLRITPAGAYYNVRFKHSGLCLDSSGAAGAVVQKTCNSSSDSQLVTMEQVRAYGFVLRFKNNGRCAEVQASSTANGAKIVHNTCSYANNQVVEFFE